MQEISDVELDKLAAKLRSLYSRRRALDVPNFKGSARNRELKYWRETALAVLRNNADPIDWIDAAFEFNKLPNGPYVTALKGENMVRNYHAYRSKNANGSDANTMIEFIDECFRHCLRVLNENSKLPESERQTLQELLLDPFNRIRPFVAVACAPGDKKVLEECLDAAKAFARTSPVILEAIANNEGNTEIFK